MKKLAKADPEQFRKFGNLEMLAKQTVEGFITGLHKSPYHGFSVEFAEHRIYNPGESIRHIDWKVFAKTDRLYTKQYEEETNLRCHLLLDVSSSMYYPVESRGKLAFGVQAAAALAYLLQKQRDAVGLTLFSDGIDQHTPVKSTSVHLNRLYIILENLLREEKPPPKKTAVATIIHQIAEKIHKRSLVIIFSDMFDNIGEKEELFNALQHLKHKKHEILIFRITDKKTEENFEFANRPYRFIDNETGEKVNVRPAEVRDFYLKSMKKEEAVLKSKCRQYKIDLVEADINEGLDKVLLPYLIKRKKMS